MDEQEISRRQLLAVLGGAGAVAAIGAAALLNPTEAAAQGGPSTPLPAGIVSVQGSWVGTLTARGTSKGLATFTSNGGLMTTNQKDTLITAPQGGGHGVWKQDGKKIQTRLFKFVADSQGVLASIIEEHTDLEIDDTGNVLTGKGTFKMYSLTGKELLSGEGDFSAKRITIDGSGEFL